MIGYRCKCGERTAWSSMGVPRCDPCLSCGSTLAAHPDGHLDPLPHDWREGWNIERTTGERFRERECSRCWKVERLPVEPEATA